MEKDPQNTKGPEGPIARSDLSARLKVLEERYSSRAEALRAYGVAKTTYDKWLYEKSSPSLESIAKIAKAAGVSLDWLAFGEGGPSAEQRPGIDRKQLQIDYLIMDKINDKYRELYAKLPKHYDAEPAPAPYTMYFTYNRLILIEDEAERDRTLDTIIATHEHDIHKMEKERRQSRHETADDQKSA